MSEDKRKEKRKEIEAFQKEVSAAVSARDKRGRFVLRFTERQRVEGMTYSAGEVAGFEEVLYAKVIKAGTAVDFIKWAGGRVKALTTELKAEQKVADEKANKKPETKEVTGQTAPPPNQPKTRDVNSPR